MLIRATTMPIQVGQFVRVTKDRLIPGMPVLDDKSWVSDVTEGTITKIKQADAGVLVTVQQAANATAEFFVSVSYLGPLLNHNGFRLEVLNRAPDQGFLFSEKGGAA